LRLWGGGCCVEPLIKAEIDQIRQAHQLRHNKLRLPRKSQMEYQRPDKRPSHRKNAAQNVARTSSRYGVEVTPELKLKDDEGWYPR